MLKFYQEKSFLNGFIKLVKNCNHKILEIYNNDFNITYKDDKSPLTNADLESNKIIRYKVTSTKQYSIEL